MNLVFRLGGSGFSLSVEDLVEIREENTSQLAGGSSHVPYLLGTLTYRDQEIPVVDLKGFFRISAETASDGLSIVLVLFGESGFWGVPVSRIEGIFPLVTFSACRCPLLSMLPGPRPYSTIELWRGEPIVRCDALWLEQFWGRA
jgi:hypothetical protein